VSAFLTRLHPLLYKGEREGRCDPMQEEGALKRNMAATSHAQTTLEPHHFRPWPDRPCVATPWPTSGAPKPSSATYYRGQNVNRNSASVEQRALVPLLAAVG
jgi:hypothetical protein